MNAHIRPSKVIKMLNDFFCYQKMAKIVWRRLASCDSCQRNKVTNQTCFSKMKNYLPERPNEILSIDFYGPLPASKGGFKYILSTIDAFSKYLVLYSLRRANSKENGIQPVLSSIRHPQSNIVERIHRELSRFFRSVIGENHASWWTWITIIETCINGTTYYETTEYTPIELHLNKKPKRAWGNWLNFPQNNSKINYSMKLIVW